MTKPRTWFTSDEHYGHKNIIAYCNRPFDNVEHMTEELVRRHNVVVSPNDTVWHLGDFAMDERLVPKVLPRLNGHHCLIAGNHDTCHPLHKNHKPSAVQRYLDYGFLTVGLNAELLTGETFRLHHMPYTTDDRHDDRFAAHRPVQKDDQWLLHGHVHESWDVRQYMLNVGVDVCGYAPVSLDELQERRVQWLMKQPPGTATF